MNIFTKFGYRFYQKTMYVAAMFLHWREPHVLHGYGSLADVPSTFSARGVSKPLVVCDTAAIQRGALDSFFTACARKNIKYAVYDGVLPNPTVDQVESGLRVYLDNACDCVVAVGGGSVIDCAKIIAARVVRPKKSVNQMRGLLKIRKKLPVIYAVPTTAGTGSECTLAAVITDADKRDKYAVNDPALIPAVAVIDPTLTEGLPPMLTATTGMDALTHAVESYIGKENTSYTKRKAVQAVQLIFDNLAECVRNGHNLDARAAMQRAAYLAGLAFTRAYVGYVHALAHALGGKYGIAHGLANAVLLPKVLRRYGSSAWRKLASLAKAVGIADKTDAASVAAEKFICAIEQLNRELNIPDNFGGQVDAQDISELALHACKEANPLYPVPQLWDKAVFEEILTQVQ